MNKKEKNEYVLTKLNEMYPNPKCELTYKKDYELLLKVMLSAQTTDKRVNMSTKELFEKYDSLEKLNSMSLKDLESYLRPIGMYKQKSIRFKEIVKMLIGMGGYVPNDKEKLLLLPGVGRKTINVVLSNLYGEALIAVDTHVERVSTRLGYAKKSDNVLTIENNLMKNFPKDKWKNLHHQMVLFGRYQCKAIKPSCQNCPFKDICKEKRKTMKNN